ncbi:MAG TPA: DUF4019 domain-containing protein [Chthoniobacteraceae bacterium]
MRASKLLFRLFFVLAVLALTSIRAAAASKPEEEAQKAAEKWLALIDAGKVAESWKEAAAAFRTAVPQDQWQQSITTFRQPFGKLVSRTLKSAKFSTSLPGAPDGKYVVLQFDTSFANKKDTIETVTPMLDKDGKWRVSGYYIK